MSEVITAMMIRDDSGNEHELTVGQLVQINRWGVDLLWRVRAIHGSRVVCTDPVSGASSTMRCSLVTWIGDAKIRDDDTPSLWQRRQRLLNNLEHARCQCGGDDMDLLTALRNALTCDSGRHAWFWQSVAESLDDPRQVSYALTKDAYDSNAKRKRCRIAKFLKTAARRFGLELTGDQADRVGELFGAHFPPRRNYTFEIVRGGSSVYDGYADRANNGWGSCMHIEGTGDAQPSLRWYDENPDKVGLVKIMKDGVYVGRALIWTTNDGSTVVDRVYPSDNGPHITALHEWCEVSGHDYKTVQGCHDGNLRSGRDDYTVTVKSSHSGAYPYCDTFKYTDDDPGDSMVLTLRTTGGNYVFNTTCGTYGGGDDACRCVMCDGEADEGICPVSDDGLRYCVPCFREHFVDLDYERPGGGRVSRTVERDQVVLCDRCGAMRLHHHVEQVSVKLRLEDWCEDCSVEDSFCCDGCDTVWSIDYAAVVDGKIHCPDCEDDNDGQVGQEAPAPQSAESVPGRGLSTYQGNIRTVAP